MGIRFYCPNGHKLNVKEFQAGQRGLCPVCGVKMQIPLQSTRPSSHEEESHPHGGAVEVPPGLPGVAAAVQRDGTPPIPPPTPSAAASSGVQEPLVEAGTAVWYVRPPSGGQYGPATAEVMRTWLAEGRVAADAIVWREGWSNWQEAGVVFPQLTRVVVTPVLDTLAIQSIKAPTAPHAGRQGPATLNPQLLVVGGLVATVVVLFMLFIAVLMRQ